MKLPPRLRRKAGGADGPGTSSSLHDETGYPYDDPLREDGAEPENEPEWADTQNRKPHSLLSGLSSRLPGRRRKTAEQSDKDPDNPSEAAVLGEDQLPGAPARDGGETLEDMLASEAGAEDSGGLLEDYSQLDAKDPAQKEEATALQFDTRRSTILEPVVRYLLVAGLVCFCIVSVLAAGAVYRYVTSDQQSTPEPGAAVAAPDAQTAPAQRAGELGEEFAHAYLAYPSAENEGSGDYLESLQPYLHPDADPALFSSEVADGAAGVEVSYASTRSVEKAAGEDRYRVVVDARLSSADAENGQSTSRVLSIHLKVPPRGGEAYVVAPPTVTEAPAGGGSGQPGIYGYSEAQSFEQPEMVRTVEDFMEALYAPTDNRPLVEEELAPGAEVEGFPPEEHSFEGIERAAVYYRDSAEEIDEAESQGFSALYDLEIYAAVTDEESGSQRLDSWALTVGEDEEGNFEITSVN